MNSARASAKSKRKRAAKIAKRQRDTPLALDRSIGRKKRTKKIDYEAFIRSPEWAAIRVRLWEQQGRHCAACGSFEDLHVHHMTYARFGGTELLSDLVGLCALCHRLVHDLHKRQGGSLLTATRALLHPESQAPLVKKVQRVEHPVGKNDPNQAVWGADRVRRGSRALPT